jgi:vitellogenic carboxypeptidase-like protein
LWLKGLGIGNGFISAEDQSLYAEYVNTLGYVTKDQMDTLIGYDTSLLAALAQKNYTQALVHSQEALHFFVSQIMNLTNIYDSTFSDNFLTNHEYVCYLQKPSVRRGIHVGNMKFNKGFVAYNQLNESIMVSKKPWLSEALERGIEVLIYNGNHDVIVNIPGTNR